MEPHIIPHILDTLPKYFVLYHIFTINYLAAGKRSDSLARPFYLHYTLFLVKNNDFLPDLAAGFRNTYEISNRCGISHK